MPSQPVRLYQGNLRGGGKDMHSNDERKQNKRVEEEEWTMTTKALGS